MDPVPTEDGPEPEFSYFGIQATWGATKHFGGLRATDQLAELCQIGKTSSILEVGCGVGLNSCHLRKQYGCRVVSVDLSPRMVHWAVARAQRKGLADRIAFGVADIQALPFENARFDAVLSESVTAFPPNTAQAVGEYVRVTRPGGYVGLNEGTWLQSPPPVDLAAFVARTMAGANFRTADDWQALLEAAGLRDLTVRSYKLGAVRQRLDEMRGLDRQDILDRFRAMGSFLSLYRKDPAFRRYAKGLTPSRAIMKDLFAYLGYGLYVGRVPG
jgi:SAM-dependent methyltransferase